MKNFIENQFGRIIGLAISGVEIVASSVLLILSFFYNLVVRDAENCLFSTFTNNYDVILFVNIFAGCYAILSFSEISFL